jgi:hypothetical protein
MPEPGVDRMSNIERDRIWIGQDHTGRHHVVRAAIVVQGMREDGYSVTGPYVLAEQLRGAVARAERLEAALRQIAANRPLDLTAQEIAERALDGGQ